MCGGSEDHVKCHSQSAICNFVTANQRVALAWIGKRDLLLPPVRVGLDLPSQDVRMGNSVTRIHSLPPIIRTIFNPSSPSHCHRDTILLDMHDVNNNNTR